MRGWILDLDWTERHGRPWARRIDSGRVRFALTYGFRRAYDARNLVPAGLAARPRRGYFLGGCNHRVRTVRLNTELVKKPKDLLEYVVVHEMLHLVEPTHSERFLRLMSKHCPGWREARAELNELPLAAASWNDQESVLRESSGSDAEGWS